MGLGRGSRTTGVSDSVSGLQRATGWERGAIRGGDRLAGVGDTMTTLITITLALITSISTIIGTTALCIVSIIMVPMHGTAESGHIIGARTSTLTRAVTLGITIRHILALTM